MPDLQQAVAAIARRLRLPSPPDRPALLATMARAPLENDWSALRALAVLSVADKRAAPSVLDAGAFQVRLG